LPNLAKFINQETGSDIPIDQSVVRAGESRLFEYPFVYMTGHGNVRFTENEINNLRKWMLRGGFLYADDDYGMDESFRARLSASFPNAS